MKNYTNYEVINKIKSVLDSRIIKSSFKGNVINYGTDTFKLPTVTRTINNKTIHLR